MELFEILKIIAQSIGFFVLAIILIIAVPRWVWILRYIFFPLNYLYWFLLNPFRFFFKKYEDSPIIRKIARFNFKVFLIIRFSYELVLYIVYTPFRILTAIYFDLMLFYSAALRDHVVTRLSNDKVEDMNLRQFFKWLKLLFKNLPSLIVSVLKLIFHGLAMFVTDIVIPSMTVYHGTDDSVVISISRNGTWIAGTGDFGGAGNYFAIKKSVGEYYAQDCAVPALIIARISLPFIRPIHTFPDKIDDTEIFPLKGGDGLLKSEFLRGTPWRLTELWRVDRKWWELCIIQYEQGTEIYTWRIRPIAELHERRIKPIRYGILIWPYTIKDWLIFLISCLLVYPVVSISYWFILLVINLF